MQTDNPTLVTKGEDESLIWEFTLTADEQAKSDFNFVKWHKFDQSSLVYDLVGGETFVKAFERILNSHDIKVAQKPFRTLGQVKIICTILGLESSSCIIRVSIQLEYLKP